MTFFSILLCTYTIEPTSCTNSFADSSPYTYFLIQVKWVHTDPGEDLSLFSVAKDGRLTQWYFGDSRLKSKDIFSFTQDFKSDKSSFEGV